MDHAMCAFEMNDFAAEGMLYSLTGQEMFEWKRLLLCLDGAQRWANFKLFDLTESILATAKENLSAFEAKHGLEGAKRPSFREVSLFNQIGLVEFPVHHGMRAYDE